MAPSPSGKMLLVMQRRRLSPLELPLELAIFMRPPSRGRSTLISTVNAAA